MPLVNTTSRWELDGDGVSTGFGFDNLIFAATDLVVYVDGVLQTLNVHYTVAPSSIGNYEGGLVTFLVAPPVGVRNVILERAVPNNQLAQYPTNDKFPSAVHQKVVDKLTVLVQQIGQRIGRMLTLDPAAPTGDPIYIPEPEPGKVLAWDDDGKLHNAEVGDGSAILLPLAISQGGTGANTAALARAAFGLGTAAVLDVGTTANKIVRLDGAGKLPAVDGSQLTGLTAGDQLFRWSAFQ